MEKIKRYSHDKGSSWLFSPADVPFYNVLLEAPVKTIGRTLDVTNGDQLFSDFQTIIYGAAELANEIPTGEMPIETDHWTYLVPMESIQYKCAQHCVSCLMV